MDRARIVSDLLDELNLLADEPRSLHLTEDQGRALIGMIGALWTTIPETLHDAVSDRVFDAMVDAITPPGGTP